MIYVIGERLGGGQGYTSSDRMADLLGIKRETFMHDVVWLNLFDHPGSDPDKIIDMVDRASTPDDAIILLGRVVAQAYGMGTLGPLAVARRHGGMGCTVVAFPHPSGINRWWNRKDNVIMARETLERIWKEHR